jgi:hypothetical protein
MLSPQVRQEPNLDHGELRDGFSASTFGPREIPQYRHEDEEQSVVFGRSELVTGFDWMIAGVFQMILMTIYS